MDDYDEFKDGVDVDMQSDTDSGDKFDDDVVEVFDSLVDVGTDFDEDQPVNEDDVDDEEGVNVNVDEMVDRIDSGGFFLFVFVGCV